LKRRDPKGAPESPSEPFHNPFGALKSTLKDLPPGPEKPAKPAPRGPARAVVRMERKGRSGKEVTVVEQLELPRAELEKWLKDLKNALGCGGSLEEDALMLQGDQRERLPQLLTARGVRKVSVG
jgi:translation initiation factor 1